MAENPKNPTKGSVAKLPTLPAPFEGMLNSSIPMQIGQNVSGAQIPKTMATTVAPPKNETGIFILVNPKINLFRRPRSAFSQG
jgi:hypothetical protein